MGSWQNELKIEKIECYELYDFGYFNFDALRDELDKLKLRTCRIQNRGRLLRASKFPLKSNLEKKLGRERPYQQINLLLQFFSVVVVFYDPSGSFLTMVLLFCLRLSHSSIA